MQLLWAHINWEGTWTIGAFKKSFVTPQNHLDKENEGDKNCNGDQHLKYTLSLKC